MTIQLVRHIPISKPIGAIVDVYRGNAKVQIGEVAEITDPEGNPLNIAKVIDLPEKNGAEMITLKMIA